MTLLKRMLKELPFSSDELHNLIATAPYRYKVFKIPKRAPNEFRTIAQPTPEIKLIQRWLIENVFQSLPVHKAATAYREGVSIADHAARHAKKRFLLKMDFRNFFPSISFDDVYRHLVVHTKLSNEEARVVCHLVCWRDKPRKTYCLSIGAPSSPLLSNAIMYDFDRKMVELCKQRKVSYSRYADDLAFSTSQKEVLSDIVVKVKDVCKELDYPRLRINHKKTVSTSRAFRRVLVGLVLTPNGKVSLGRDKKRLLRAKLHRFSMESLAAEEVPKLRGELAFAWSVESSFIESLLRHFGTDVFRKLDLPFNLES